MKVKIVISSQLSVVKSRRLGGWSIASKNLLGVLSSSLLILHLVSCNSGTNSTNVANRQSSIDTIKSIEAKLKTTATPDVNLYNRAITAYTGFATNFPTDTMAPACIFDAAGVAMSLNQYQRAINLYDTIAVKYPNFKKAPDCIFIRGFIYDDKLKDTAKARALYQEVIAKYPHDSLASQARAAIAILGKSYDEIIKQFEEKNKKKG